MHLSHDLLVFERAGDLEATRLNSGVCISSVRDYNLPHYMSHCEYAFKVHGLEATTWLSKKEHWEIWREHLFAMGKQACGLAMYYSARQDGKVGLTPHDHELITKKSWLRGLAEASITPKRKASEDCSKLLFETGVPGAWIFERRSEAGRSEEGQDLQRRQLRSSALLADA